MKREDALKLTEKALNGLAESLQQGRSERLTEFLEVMARFPRYSLRNVVLIAAQRPDATYVAGFRAWKELGRQVVKGEKGIGIVAPMIGRKQDGRAESERPAKKDEGDAAMFGFRVVHVFDISQTVGEKLPELARPQGEPGPRLSMLEEVVRQRGIELEYTELTDGSLGLSKKGEILIQRDLTAAESFAVLAHELAHESLHQPSDRPRPPKRVRETEAEAVAHVVCHAFGIDSTTSSVEYIQLYNGDLAALNDSLHAIQTTAAQILVEMSRAEAVYYAQLASIAA